MGQTADLPFILCALEPLDRADYDSATTESDLIRNSYNPQTQVSDLPQYGGTALTYSDSYTGILGEIRDDARQSDT
jgi:hypothetical protein